MSEQLFESIARYHTVMAMVKSMLDQSLISQEEYDEIDRKTAQEYGLDLSVIYR